MVILYRQRHHYSYDSPRHFPRPTIATIPAQTFKLGFIGAGKMAESTARGVVISCVLPASRISTAHFNAHRRKAFQSFGVTVFDHNHQPFQSLGFCGLSIFPTESIKFVSSFDFNVIFNELESTPGSR